MAHLIASDDKFRDLAYDDGYRAYLITRRDAPIEYRFGRTQGKRVRVRARCALRRVNGFLKNMIGAIANSKLGVWNANNWVTRNPDPSRVRND